MSNSQWRIFDLEALIEKADSRDAPYLEFLRVPSMSCGIYQLSAGSKDMQGYHDEDEVYLVVKGKGRLQVEDEDREVGPGSVLYVSATSEHSFFEIEEDMTMLVFFSSPGTGIR